MHSLLECTPVYTLSYSSLWVSFCAFKSPSTMTHARTSTVRSPRCVERAWRKAWATDRKLKTSALGKESVLRRGCRGFKHGTLRREGGAMAVFERTDSRNTRNIFLPFQMPMCQCRGNCKKTRSYWHEFGKNLQVYHTPDNCSGIEKQLIHVRLK